MKKRFLVLLMSVAMTVSTFAGGNTLTVRAESDSSKSETPSIHRRFSGQRLRPDGSAGTGRGSRCHRRGHRHRRGKGLPAGRRADPQQGHPAGKPCHRGRHGQHHRRDHLPPPAEPELKIIIHFSVTECLRTFRYFFAAE